MNVICKGFLSAFFPKTCACCGEIIDEEEQLCDYCREMLVRCDPIKRCVRCGMVKRDCVCKSRLLFFDGCIAPFVNTGAAKTALYRFKFGHRLFAKQFFAEQMALCVKNEYRDCKFDAICYVPMYRRKERRRGYNQSRLLAEELGRILQVPIAHNALICRKNAEIQHDLDARRRAVNVRDLYACSGHLDNKTILLVDDIKTTGATLNECAKQLTVAGASSIWCVTALTTDKKKKSKEGDSHGN